MDEESARAARRAAGEAAPSAAWGGIDEAAGHSLPLTVSHAVIVEMVRLAALEVAGVLGVSRAPGWPAWLAGSPVRARVRDGGVQLRVWVVARPNQALRPLTSQVAAAVTATVERLLGLQLVEVTVVVTGVGA